MTRKRMGNMEVTCDEAGVGKRPFELCWKDCADFVNAIEMLGDVKKRELGKKKD